MRQKGWKNESGRHALAARGIRTLRNNTKVPLGKKMENNFASKEHQLEALWEEAREAMATAWDEIEVRGQLTKETGQSLYVINKKAYKLWLKMGRVDKYLDEYPPAGDAAKLVYETNDLLEFVR